MRITDPRLIALPASTLPDAESIEMVYSLIVPTLDSPTSRQAGRLVLERADTDLREAAALRLERTAARLLAAEPALADIAAGANHAALSAGLPAFTAARAHLATSAGLLRAGMTLLRATTDTSLVLLPSEGAMRAATEALVGAHALANSGDDALLMPAEPELKAMARLALTVHDGALDLPNLRASWRAYVLLLTALVGTGGARAAAEDRYAPDAARFVGALLQFRASQLDTLAKLGSRA